MMVNRVRATRYKTIGPSKMRFRLATQIARLIEVLETMIVGSLPLAFYCRNAGRRDILVRHLSFLVLEFYEE